VCTLTNVCLVGILESVAYGGGYIGVKVVWMTETV
jgi:hypothetical protein